MRIVAYCTEVAAVAVQKALGITPLTSPPLIASQFPVRKLRDLDMLYFRLHSTAQGQWYGEGQDGSKPTALVIRNLAHASLSGCVVLIANCYGTEDIFVSALTSAGAIVIAGPGPNYGAARRVVGADLLARWVWRGLRLGLPVRWALRLAKMRLRLDWRQFKTALGQKICPSKDALAFEIIAGGVV